MIEFATTGIEGAKIRVIGVGGGGCNAINNMVNRGLNGVDLISVNTDKQALGFNKAALTVQIGKETTQGKGAGSLPEIGKKSAEESTDELKEAIKGSDMVFVTCGMGGGTGTGASPVVAKIASELGALVVGIVTTPFTWEGPKRQAYAKDGIADLRQFIDALIVIPNQKLVDTTDRKMKFSEAYKTVDDILYNATRGISEIITTHGYVNVDFADVKTVMKGMGDAIMGIGIATGENRALEATENALNSPLLDGITIKGAQYALVNITAGNDLGFHEIDEVVSKLSIYAGPDVNIIHGVVVKDEPMDEIMVTVVATGFDKKIEAVQESKTELERDITQSIGSIFSGVKKPIASPFSNGQQVKQTPFEYGHKETHAPKGYEELKSREEPAFIRNKIKYGVEGLSNPFSQASQIITEKIAESRMAVNDNFSSVAEHNEIVIEEMETQKPAFLRRILD
jgi:cell division protein FtsZ